MKKKQDGWLDEIIKEVKREIRHRKGVELFGRQINEVKVFGKTLHIDNKVPGLILDTFDNLGFETKDGQTPKIIPGGKRRTDYGWHLIINLPPGKSYQQVKAKQNFFADATKAWVDLDWIKGYVHMDVLMEELEAQIDFAWNPLPYLNKMALPWPIGYTHGNKLLVVDLAKMPHCLAGGATNFGKSSFILVLVYALLKLKQICPNRVFIALADLKGLDFYQLSNHILVLEDEGTIFTFMKRLHKEYERRKAILRKCGLKKIQGYKGDDLPYLVFIIDEFAEITSKEILKTINRAVRLYRAVGIHLVVATQRPSIVGGVMDGDTRAQFPARVCFKVSCEADSRMILGEQYNQAAWLPGDVPGRAFFNFGIEMKMVQSMFISEEMEPLLLADLAGNDRRWGFELNTKRLKPR